MTRCASESSHPVKGLAWTAPNPIRADLESERLSIRAYTLADAPALFDAVRTSLDHLLPWMQWAPGHTSIEFTTRYVAEQALALGAGEGFTNIGIGIFEKDTGELVGGTGVHDVRRDTASCETGYWVRYDKAGLGYATEACGRVLSWALGDPNAGGLGLRRVRVYCSSKNAASSRVPTKLELTPEVHQRDDYYIPGLGVTDRLGWGVLAHEWDCEHHRRAKG